MFLVPAIQHMDAVVLDYSTIKVTWTPPRDSSGIDAFFAYSTETPTLFCKAEAYSRMCEIEGLSACVNYPICVRACHLNAIASSSKLNNGSKLPSQPTLQSGMNIPIDKYFCSIPSTPCKEICTPPKGNV